VTGVRLSEIVNTVSAYRNLQAGLAGRTLAAAKQASDSSDEAMAKSLGLSSTDAEPVDQGSDQQDVVELSGVAGGQALGSQDGSEEDDSLGAIVESFMRQRQTYQFTIPGVKGVTSPISVTWEVEKAYHVVQFVPRSQLVDTEA